MNTNCHLYRKNIPRSLLGDLSASEIEDLNQHLAACAECARDRGLYQSALGQLEEVEDLPVPRHFFVYPEEQKLSPWQLFGRLNLAWRLVGATAVLLLIVSAGLVLSQARIEADRGRLTFSFGPNPVTRETPPAVSPAELAAVREQMLTAIEKRIRNEREQWIRQLKSTLSNSGRQFTRQQQEILKTALTTMEERLNQKIAATGVMLEAKSSQDLSNLYTTLQSQRDARMGLVIHMTAGFVQPGVNNRQVLEIGNLAPFPLVLKPGVRICQIILERTEGKTSYQGRFMDQDRL